MNKRALGSAEFPTHPAEDSIREERKHFRTGLTFAQLRAANVARLPLFKNAKGDPAHLSVDGSDWSPGDWMTAVVGELGEAANIMKKIHRGDFGPPGCDEHAKACLSLRKEFADVQVYLDILAYQFRIDLGEATRKKFNEVSRRVGVEIYL